MDQTTDAESIPDPDAILLACDNWLARTQGDATDFPPALEALYEAETGPARAAVKGRVCLTGAATGVALTLLTAWSDAWRAPLVAWVLPCAVWLILAACGFALLRAPRAPYRLALAVTPALSAALCLHALFLLDPRLGRTVYVGCAILVLVAGGLALRLPPRATLAFVAVHLAGMALLLPGWQAADTRDGLALLAIALATAIFVLQANWRQLADYRNAYALTLRERLRQSALSQRNTELEVLSRRDALTGLANRRAYDAWVASFWTRGGPIARPLGLIIVDVDHFKTYNDYHGHAAGDACLQAIAAALRDQLRGTSDRVARFGGEEFAILLPGLGRDLCADIAERLRHAVTLLDLPHPKAPARVVTISAGVASLPPAPGANPDRLFALADAALYAAKQAGRNRVHIAENDASPLPARP